MIEESGDGGLRHGEGYRYAPLHHALRPHHDGRIIRLCDNVAKVFVVVDGDDGRSAGPRTVRRYEHFGAAGLRRENNYACARLLRCDVQLPVLDVAAVDDLRIHKWSRVEAGIEWYEVHT